MNLKPILLTIPFILSIGTPSERCEMNARTIYETRTFYNLPGMPTPGARRLILRESLSRGIDPCLLYGIAMRESDGHHRRPSGALVRGSSGEYGMMQVMGYHFREGENPHRLEVNVMASARYLKRCLRGRSEYLAISCYNRGESSTRVNYAYSDYVMERAQECRARTRVERVAVRKERSIDCGKRCLAELRW